MVGAVGPAFDEVMVDENIDGLLNRANRQLAATQRVGAIDLGSAYSIILAE